jgi:integrase
MDRDCENCRNYKWNNGYKSCCKWTCKPDYTYEDETKRPHIPFTDDEINLLWKHKDEFYPRLYLILIYTGMRVNELLKMKSEDVDLENRYMTGGSKTKAGKNRKIPIAEKILPLLDASGEYLIMKDGEPLTYQQTRKESTIVLNSLNLPHNFHDTRHTCSTLLEKQNVSKLHIKLILGHASKDVTDRYTHIDIKDLIDDINKI